MSIDPRKPCPKTMTPEGCSSRNALFCEHGYLGSGTAETGLMPPEATERAILPRISREMREEVEE